MFLIVVFIYSDRVLCPDFRMASMEHSQAYESHTFQRKIHFLSRSVCQICEERFSSVSFSVQECTQVKLELLQPATELDYL